MTQMVHRHNPRTTFDQIKILVFGESGSGKTVFASTFPEPIFLDVDEGMGSIKTEVDFIPTHSWIDLQSAFGNLMHKKHPYKTVVLDSLNGIQRMAMERVVSTFPVRRTYEDVPTQGDYQKALLDFDRLVQYFCQLPMNVVLIAQSGTRQFEGGFVKPDFIGRSTADKVCGKVDVIGYMFRQEMKNKEGESKILPVISFNEAQHVSKDRTWKLPSVIPLPTYEKMAQYWRIP